MHPYAEPTKTTADKRPTISEVVKGPTGGSSFTVTFLPGQVLPSHRNRSRILINVIQGDGAITVDRDMPIRVVMGSVVQVAPNAPHAPRTSSMARRCGSSSRTSPSASSRIG